jgi:bifunctional non-homologous end joining protein LigD
MHVRADLSGVGLTSLHRVLWPSAGFTKGQMIDYYARVGPTMLPHLAGRPLTLGRFPQGIDGRGFAQLECRGSPPWLQTAAITLRDGRVRNLCLARDLRSLLWIANLGSIELHSFLGSLPALERPDAILFDIDPEPPANTRDAARVALLLRDRLQRHALVKTTGGLGLHVLVPLEKPHSYAETRAFARDIARELAAGDPAIVASAARRRERKGTVLVDWAQNGERRTVLAPYSLRASDVPLASAPVTWAEVRRGDDLRFGPQQVLERVQRLGDLWKPALDAHARLRAFGREPAG